MKKAKTNRLLSMGRRFESTKKTEGKIVLYYNKAERRIQRRRAIEQRSKIGRALIQARVEDLEVARLASNSHERRRAIRADRIERDKVSFTTSQGATI